jgi:hypothetical protein
MKILNITNDDLTWWKENAKEIVVEDYYNKPAEIKIEVNEPTFYKINNAIREMEKKEMPPRNDYSTSWLTSLDNVVTNFSFEPQTITIADLNMYPLKNITNLQPKSIKYDKNYTTVTWNDGTKTTVRCSNEDEYSRYNGFCSALAKKVFGTSSQVRKIVETKNEEIELAKKKAEQKEEERLAEIARKRKERHQIKYRAKQIVIEKKAKQLAKKMLGE